MALTALEANTISEGMAAAKLVLTQLEPVLHRLNVVYDSAGGVKETVTQGDLDTVPGWSGITKAQLDDGMYALTANLKGAIDTAYTQLAQLAARG